MKRAKGVKELTDFRAGKELSCKTP